MTRALVLVLLLATPCAAQWRGTIGGRAVTCIPMPGTLFVAPTGGDAATVTTLGLRCTGVPRGAPRRVIEAQVYVANLAGTLAFDGVLCKRGPSPAHPRRPVRHCCTLFGNDFAGSFTPVDYDTPPGQLPLQTGRLTAFTMGTSCRHATQPVGAVSVRDIAIAP